MASSSLIDDAIKQAGDLRPRFTMVTSRLFPYHLPGSGGITADRWLRLYYDDEALSLWDPDWIVSRILVQVEHYYRRHSQRQQGREQVTWDVATEIAITDALSAERLRFPPETLQPETFKLPSGLTAEEYQAQLLDMCNRRKASIEAHLAEMYGQELPDFGSAGSEEMREWEVPEDDPDVPAIDPLIAMMEARKMEFEQTTPGTGAREDVRTSKEKRNSAVNWRIELRGLVGTILSKSAGMADYSFLMPDPDIGLHPGLIMPGMVGAVASIAVVPDTSGSMGETRIAQATAETAAVLRTFEGDTGIAVFPTDAAVHSARQIFHRQQIKLVGGGGTDIGVGIDAAARHHPRPGVIIVISDCDTPWPDRGPRGIPVIVVRVGNGKTPKWVKKVIDVPMTH